MIKFKLTKNQFKSKQQAIYLSKNVLKHKNKNKIKRINYNFLHNKIKINILKIIKLYNKNTYKTHQSKVQTQLHQLCICMFLV